MSVKLISAISWGEAVLQTLDGTFPCLWVPFLLADSDTFSATARPEKNKTASHSSASGVRNHEMPVMMKTIKNYVFIIHPYDQCYSHGIVDRYHWITITPENEFDRDRYDVHGLCGDTPETRSREILPLRIKKPPSPMHHQPLQQAPLSRPTLIAAITAVCRSSPTQSRKSPGFS